MQPVPADLLDAARACCRVVALGPEALGLVDVEVKHGCSHKWSITTHHQYGQTAAQEYQFA